MFFMNKLDEQWILTEWSKDGKRNEEIKAVIASSMWEIWKARNGRVFHGERITTKVVAKRALLLASDYACKDSSSRKLARIGRATKWEAPLEGWFKVNTYGAYNGDNYQSGSGLVIRDERGELIPAATEPVVKISSKFRELATVLVGFQEAWGRGDNVIMELDAEATVKMLNGQRPTSWIL
ncbi:uncharacterized protein [Typha latifolia]|uniref:uncharacterized protein n=1 Tax=Typha latifolia TaxID=4733 RepID=UPI003C2F75ED